MMETYKSFLEMLKDDLSDHLRKLDPEGYIGITVYEIFPKHRKENLKYVAIVLEQSLKYSQIVTSWDPRDLFKYQHGYKAMTPYTSCIEFIDSKIAACKPHSICAVSRTHKEAANNLVKRIIFNPPATIVFWQDGTKTVVKCQNGEEFDPEKGLAMAVIKKGMGYGIFNKLMEKAERGYPDIDINIDMPSLIDGIASAAKTIMRTFGCEQDTGSPCENCRFNELAWSPKNEKFMPFCTSSNSMIDDGRSCCADFKPKEEKMFKLKEIAGPFGDCTSAYSVELDTTYTVKDFIDAVLEHCSNEWGSIAIENSKTAQECEYVKGTIKCTQFSSEMLRKTVISAKAYGGWTRMDYQLKIQ